MLSTETN